MSYLVHSGTLVATTSEELRSGAIVSVGRLTASEAIDANREINLVNAVECTVSNAKKWAKDAVFAPHAQAVNGSAEEFVISTAE